MRPATDGRMPGPRPGPVERWRGWARAFALTPLHPQWFSFRAKDRASRRVRAGASGMVLDVGCGDSTLRGEVAGRCRYFALDYPATGRDWYGAEPDVFGDASRLPFQAGSFDQVWLLDVLEHLRSPDEALREIQRVLAADGRLFLSIPCLYPLHDEPHDYQRLTEHGLRRSLAGAGFANIAIEPCGAPVETAALLGNIALARMVARLAAAFPPAAMAGVLLLPVVFAGNVLAWMLAPLARGDRFMPLGYIVVCSRAADAQGPAP